MNTFNKEVKDLTTRLESSSSSSFTSPVVLAVIFFLGQLLYVERLMIKLEQLQIIRHADIITRIEKIERILDIKIAIIEVNQIKTNFLYTGDNPILSVLTSKPVLISVAVIGGLLLLYYGLNNFGASQTTNDNVIKLDKTLSEKIHNIDANFAQRGNDLSVKLDTINTNLTSLNDNLPIANTNANVELINQIDKKLSIAVDSIVDQVLRILNTPSPHYIFPTPPSGGSLNLTSSDILNKASDAAGELAGHISDGATQAACILSGQAPSVETTIGVLGNLLGVS